MQLGLFIQKIVQAQSTPRHFPCDYDPRFLAANEADELFRYVSALPHFRSANLRAGKIQGYIHRLTLPSWSAFGTFRGIEENAKKQGSYKPNYAETKNFSMSRMDQAPRVVRDLAIKLSLFAGKPVNYFALVGYADKTHYIDWHQHGEDRGRDARVFIISLGASRHFGVREICPDCRVCDACNQSACDGHKRACADCRGAKAHREICPITTDKTRWHLFYPSHGSLITLPNEFNFTHEHAVLPDKNVKGLRISFNTKCLPTDETLDEFIERMKGEPSPLSPDTPEVQQQKRETMARNLAKKLILPYNDAAKAITKELLSEFPASDFHLTPPDLPQPEGVRVWDCHAGKKYPSDAVYVGCKTTGRDGTPFGNAKNPFVPPSHPDSHKNAPIADNAADFRKYAEKRMQDPEFRKQAVSELCGKHLLCWCKPDKPNCHAKVWMELVNR